MSQGSITYTHMVGLLTNNGMLPASIFDILARSTLTAHVRPGAQITRFRRGSIENILLRSIPFLKPGQPCYINSIDLVIIKEGL